MKLGVLSWMNGELESVGIAERARERGHDVSLFTIDDISCEEAPGGGLRPFIDSVPADRFDVVLSRAHVGHERWRDTVERLQLLSSVPGLLVVDPVDVHVGAVSKFAMMHRLTAAGVRIPSTRSVLTPDDVVAAMRDWGAVVLKPSVGFGGIDVDRFLGELTDHDVARIRQVLGTYGQMICQQYHPHDGDLRVLVVDSVPVLGAQWHTTDVAWKPFPGTPEHEETWDSYVELVEPPQEAVDIAVAATEAVGLSYSGVDMILVDGDYLVLEVNVVPGWDALPPDVRSLPDNAVVDLVEKRHASATEASRSTTHVLADQS